MEVGKENSGPTGGGRAGKLGREEARLLLGQCLKLASENKISAQNTWSLPLIENLPDLIKEDEDGGGGTNFQRASVTLEAGVKIYSYRVDSVATETFKMLGHMGRAAGPGEDDAEEGGGEGEGAADGPKRRRKTVELNPDATLEASLDALNVKKFDLAFAVDPLFHKTSAQFDEGGAKGLLLNNLSVYRGCEIVFDSMDVPEKAVDCTGYQASNAEVSLAGLQGTLEAVSQLPGQERISPTLDEILQLLGQAPAEDAAAAAEAFVGEVAAAAGDVRPAPSGSLMQTSTFSRQQGAVAAMDGDAQSGPELGQEPGGDGAEEGFIADAFAGEGGPGLADLDDYDGEYGGGDDYDAGGGGGFDDFSDGEGEQSVMQQPAGAAPFSAAKQARRGSLGGDAIQWLISAGNSNISGKAWAGGSHWRYRAAVPQASGVSGGEAEEGEEAEGGRGRRKKATRKKNEPLDFVALLEQPEQPTFEKLASKGPKRAKTVAKTLLPEDHHYKPEYLARYALRPLNRIRPHKAGQAEGAAGGFGGGNAEFDGFGDFGAGGGFSDDDEGPGGDGGDYGGWNDVDFGGEDSTLGGGGGGGTELLSAPRRVEKVEVNYSKAAKQVDVRALKETLWEGLHQVLPPEAQEDTVLSFQDVLSTVRERNPAGRLEDLSVHLCFICVLHLANEHGLVIRGAQELDRLAISNVPAPAGR